MKKILHVQLILFLSLNYCFSQIKIDSLKNEITKIEKQIRVLDSKKKELEQQISFSKKQREASFLDINITGIKATASFTEPDLMKSPDMVSEVIINIPFKDTVNVIERYQDTKWLKVIYKGVSGFILYNSLNETPELLSLIDKNASKKYKLLREKYGDEVADKIMSNSYWLGMTKRMAILSLGQPNDINKSKGAWGLNEQWVYKNNNKDFYLYFENGKLESYQN